MEKATVAYLAYMLFFALLLGGIFATPLLAFSHDMSASYTAFSYTCHQKISRSLCVFSDGKGYWVGDCTPQNGTFVDTVGDREQIREAYGSVVGYKMPVCSRDIGLYLSMFIGGLAYPFVRRIKDRYVYPAIYLVIALVPLGIDGTVQLLSDLGLLPFMYESTNELRLITGAIAGIAAAFYAIPILVNFIAGPEDDGPPPARKGDAPPAPKGGEEPADEAGGPTARTRKKRSRK
jgi:uncharacterized membrane protein